MNYDFAVPAMWIQGTRSPFSDTDYATLGIVAVAPDGTTIGTYGPVTRALGDVGSGSVDLSMALSDIDVPDGGSMGVVFTVMNKGSFSGGGSIETALDTVCAGIMGALAGGQLAGATTAAGAAIAIPLWEAALAAAGVLAIMEGVHLLFLDCDGWVVNGTTTLGRTELDQIAGQATWGWSTHYHGSDSPDGCGSNSDYTVSYETIASSLPGIAVPDVLSQSPAEAIGALAHLGLFGKIMGQEKGLVDSPQVFEQHPSAGTHVLPSTTVELDVLIPRGGPPP